MQTRSTEDYLKNIYRLQQEDEKATTSSLANILKISSASVSEMVSKLSKNGWIKNKPYHGFQLTSKGEKEALALVRKHRLLETFLQHNLNYSWSEVHDEAERLEHVVSDKFIKKLDEYLGFPKFDPHGDPIPNSKGIIHDAKHIQLVQSNVGSHYIISKVNDDSNDILFYLAGLGIKLNTKIQVCGKLTFDGSVIIKLNNKKQILSKKIAEHIFVSKYKL